MARLPRIVIPGLPHHVTQRGNGRAQVFFEDGDYQLYLDLLSAAARRAHCAVWAYCLMPNHIHAMVVPSDDDGLRRTFADAHRRYTGYINARARRTGHVWQGRFAAVAMDEAHTYHAFRYISLNPVRAGLVARAAEWPWSSVRAHLAGKSTAFVDVAPGLERIEDFAGFLDAPFDEAEAYGALRKAETIGRPVGSRAWLEDLERQMGGICCRKSVGRNP